MALNLTKLNQSNPSAGIVKRLPVISKQVKTGSTQKIFVDGRKVLFILSIIHCKLKIFDVLILFVILYSK